MSMTSQSRHPAAAPRRAKTTGMRIARFPVHASVMSESAAPCSRPAQPRPRAVCAVDTFVPPPYSALRTIATQSLLANVNELDGRRLLSAGAHQFKALWTRDFGWSVRGLLAAGRKDVVRDQLTLLLAHVRKKDGLVPRTLDSMNPKWRVVLSSIWWRLGLALRPQLKPEYEDQHGQIAIDGNALVILAAVDYVKTTGDTAWWKAHEKELVAAFRFYDGRMKGGLVTQPPFSDWQDSIAREGPTFYTNLLYQTVMRRVADNPAFGVDRGRVRAHAARMEAAFFDARSGLYRSLVDGPRVSLDGNLLAIDLGYLPPSTRRAQDLYAAILRSPFWTRTGTPGFVTYPAYPGEWRAFVNELCDLRHYHDDLQWSWLIAMSAKVARAMGDERSARLALQKLERLAVRDASIAEIYDADHDAKPWRSLLYRSEQPFSWGAAVTLEALADP